MPSFLDALVFGLGVVGKDEDVALKQMTKFVIDLESDQLWQVQVS